MTHPQQPIILGDDEVIRFKSNKIIEYLFNSGKLSLNELAMMDFSDEDRIQISQLLGYSVSGFGSLSYVPHEMALECDEEADRIYDEFKLGE
jgi:hypothetical protein